MKISVMRIGDKDFIVGVKFLCWYIHWFHVLGRNKITVH